MNGMNSKINSFTLRFWFEQRVYRSWEESLFILWHCGVHGTRGCQPARSYSECWLVVFWCSHGKLWSIFHTEIVLIPNLHLLNLPDFKKKKKFIFLYIWGPLNTGSFWIISPKCSHINVLNKSHLKAILLRY